MNWKHFVVMAFALLVAMSLGSTRLAAQTQSTGDVTGVVTDPSGATIPDAKVELKDNSKGNVQESKTDKNGAYRFYLLSPGSYTVTVTATGFSSQTRVADIAVGQIATLSFTLSVGSSSTTVTVTEAAPLMSVDNGNVAATLSQQQISQVPNPGNDMSYIAQLSPGAVMNTGAGYGNFSSYGTPGTSNLFTLDGMDDNDPFLNLNNSGATNLLLGANEVQEATVVNGAYTGEYGTLAGAQVNYVTKSGGNNFHGNAVYFWNGSALNATDWFVHAYGENKAFDNANQWAGSLGGPIVRDKLFFFFNTEGLRVILPTAAVARVPTPLLENYIMDPTNGTLATSGLSASLPFYQQAFNLWNAAKGASNAQNVEANGGCGDLAGTTIPAYLGGGTFGSASPCGLQYQSTNPNFTHEALYSGRVDWNAGSNDRAFLRVGYDHGLQASYTNVISPLFNAESDQPQWQGQFNETHTFSPTLVNQLIVSGAWYSAIFTNSDRAASLAAFPTTLSFVGAASLSSMGNALYDWPQGRNVTQYQIGDDLSKTLSNQTLKFGVKFRRNDVSDHDYGVYTSGRSYVTLADFAAGLVRNTNSGGTLNNYMIQNFPSDLSNPTGVGRLSQPAALYSLAGYVEDDWRARSNLTLTFAVRLEHYSNPVCQTNCFARLTGPFADVSHDPTEPYNEAINVNLHQALQGLTAVGFAPRFGFAWQPFGTSRNFVVRGGAGIFYDQFPGQVVDNFSQNPPLYNQFVITPLGATGIPVSPTQTGAASNVYAIAAQNNAAFVSGFTGGGTLASISAAAPFFSPPGIFTANKETQLPQYQKWSLEIQKGFGANTSITVGYYGNHGIHELIVDPSVNAYDIGLGVLPATVPDARFSEVQFADTHSVSNYNGVTASFTHRFTGWGSGVLSANYTYSHAFDEVSNGGLLPFVYDTNISPLAPQIPGDYRNNYGPADYDVRHYLALNYVWELPIRRALGGRGWAPLVDGWQVSGAIFARSGLPYTAIDSAFTGLNNYFGSVYPNFAGGPSGCGESAAYAGVNGVEPGSCLTVGQFPQAGGNETSFGVNGLRNNFRGPGYTDVDFSINKNTSIPHWEAAKLGIAFQFFNLFNHPNFDQPVNDVEGGAGYFGTIQSTVSTPTSILGAFLGGDAAPRIIQLKAS
ncbi:MAG: carboxypeptidase regulatory-like domain-containing protein, partial [Candidatus Acidiferrales bacterium]